MNSAKADLTQQDTNRNTALHLACSKVTTIHRQEMLFLFTGHGEIWIVTCHQAHIRMTKEKTSSYRYSVICQLVKRLITHPNNSDFFVCFVIVNLIKAFQNLCICPTCRKK